MTFHCPTIAIFGVGLIGGSLALALKQIGAVDHVIGVGRSRVNLDLALERGAIDEIAFSAEAAAEQAQIIVLATPVGAMEDMLTEIRPVIDADKIITDVGSVKHGVVSVARKVLGFSIDRFVPGHPVAGKEHSGVAAAAVDLFVNHNVALTPIKETDPAAVRKVELMWRAVGAEVVSMEVSEHDRVLAITSHLPHVLAYAMVHYLADSPDHDKCYEMAAGGFYDFTRIASSDPVMWRDICHMNKQTLLQNIEGFQDKLTKISALLGADKGVEIEALFESAKKSRAIVTERRKS